MPTGENIVADADNISTLCRYAPHAATFAPAVDKNGDIIFGGMTRNRLEDALFMVNDLPREGQRVETAFLVGGSHS